MGIDIIFNPNVPILISSTTGIRMEKDDFMNLQNFITKGVKDHNFCKGEICPKYTKRSIRRSPYIFLSYNDKREINAFATVFHINKEILRIDLICTYNAAPPGTGTNLMNRIERFAIEGKIKKLLVVSIAKSMKFYEDMGFSLNLNAETEGNNTVQFSNSNSNSNSASNNSSNSASNNSNSASNNNSMGASNNNSSGRSGSNNNNMGGSNSNAVYNWMGDVKMTKLLRKKRGASRNKTRDKTRPNNGTRKKSI